MPWEYPDENFVVLCEKCHDKNHAFEYTQKLCESCKKQPVPRLARLCLGCQDSFVELMWPEFVRHGSLFKGETIREKKEIQC